MKVYKKIARRTIFPLAMKMGVDTFFRNRAKNSILNVMYHGVASSDSCYFSPRHISEKQFEEHLRYYAENFEIISLNEAFEMLESKEPLEKKYITVSFDDGFKNNLITALPILEKYKIPVTFFVSSVCIENEENNYLWAETIAALNYFYRDQPIEVDNKIFKNLICEEEDLVLSNFIKSLPYNRRDTVLISLEEKYDLRKKMKSLPEELWRLLNKEELIELSKSEIVTIGSHGHRHFNLAEIGIEEAKNELLTSKELLSKSLNVNIDLVAYPDGSYNDEVKDIAEKLGYKGQLAVNYRSQEDRVDPRIMNRHGISSCTTFDSNMLFLNMAFKKKGLY